MAGLCLVANRLLGLKLNLAMNRRRIFKVVPGAMRLASSLPFEKPLLILSRSPKKIVGERQIEIDLRASVRRTSSLSMTRRYGLEVRSTGRFSSVDRLFRSSAGLWQHSANP